MPNKKTPKQKPKKAKRAKNRSESLSTLPFTPPANRKPVYVLSNLAVSLDGKIAPKDRTNFPLGTETDRDEMRRLRAKVDAVLFGTKTLNSHPQFAFSHEKDDPHAVQPWNIVISRKLDGVSPVSPFFKEPRGKRLLILTEKPTPSRLKEFQKTSQVVMLPPLKKGARGASFWAHLSPVLQSLRINRLLVEGGGEVMWTFLREDLIDEVHLTLTPKIIGGKTAPSLVSGDGFDHKSILGFKLLEAKVVQDEIFLTYLRIRHS